MNSEIYPRLTDLHLRLVSKCNLNCKHCYASDWFVRSNFLETSLVCGAIDEAMELGLEKVTFTGGEPMLHAEIAALLEHCIRRGIPAKLETNGLLLNRNNNRVRDLLVDNKDLLYLYISYDLAEQRGISEQDHDTIKDIAIYLHSHGVDVRLQTTLTEINGNKLDELTELSRNYGIRQRVFLDPSLMGNGASLTSFDLDFVLQTYAYLKSLNLDMELELPPLITGEANKGCGWGINRCEIMPNGDVTTCAPITFTHTGFTAGNIGKKSLKQIWYESDYFKGMRQVRQIDFHGVCRKYIHWEGCRGSCRAYAWTRGDNWFSPYPLCQLYVERYPERAKAQLFDDEPSLGPLASPSELVRRLAVLGNQNDVSARGCATAPPVATEESGTSPSLVTLSGLKRA